MARRRHTPEQILAKLRDADVMLADGLPVAELAKELETSEQTYHRWRNQYAGIRRRAVTRGMGSHGLSERRERGAIQ